MTKIIGLTGGIGSGKTTVAKYLQSLGIPVYIADEEAKKIMVRPDIVAKLVSEFGSGILTGTLPDRRKIARLVFDDKIRLQKLNNIIHPAVRQDFVSWLRKHSDEDFVVKEAAILFESGSYKDVDVIINVIAPVQVRVERVIKRDKVTREEVLARMANQWTDAERAAMSDFNLENVNIADMESDINNILKKLRNF